MEQEQAGPEGAGELLVPAIVLTGALEKPSNAGPLLKAIEDAVALDAPPPGSGAP